MRHFIGGTYGRRIMGFVCMLMSLCVCVYPSWLKKNKHIIAGLEILYFFTGPEANPVAQRYTCSFKCRGLPKVGGNSDSLYLNQGGGSWGGVHFENQGANGLQAPWNLEACREQI